MSKSKVIHKFKKGDVIHLDTIYNIMAFVDPYMEPYRNKYISKDNWNPEMTDEYKFTQSVTIEIITTTN